MTAELDPEAEHAFHRLVGRLDYPMFVVTTVAADDGERSGCLVGFATQCSIHPPRWVVWLSLANHTCTVDPIAAWVAGDEQVRPDLGYQSVKRIEPGHAP